ncbi:glycoside hydrolase domain-containing protein, partial [Phytoactinopolyspora endophytica]|uniref:glycoside hydrolase domain-containing protein n=1 Tax=Phytoactinopolyspora endophytica TaxID=1642495 RepID=UPI00197CA130
MRSRTFRKLIRPLTVLMTAGLTAGLLVGADHPPGTSSSTAAATPQERDYVGLVNPWVEADIGRFFFFQSASNPFGMVKLRPDTSTHHARDTGYRKNENDVKGFSHLHDWQLSGVQVMPTSGESAPKLDGDTGWQSHVEHDSSEVAEPGYHKLHLDRYDIDAELTVTDRVGMHRYTYGQSGPSEIIINLGGVLGEAVMENAHVTKVSDRELEGYVVQHGERYPGRHETTLFFNIQFDTPFDSLHGWADGERVDDGAAVDKVAGDDAGVYVGYDHLDADDQVQMKVALSLTSTDGARRNLEAELPGWDFDAVKAESQDTWNEMLGRIDVRGGTEQQQVKFYTDLFHVLCGRSVISDADGTYMDDTWNNNQVKQIPTDHKGEPKFAMYNYDALWLTQWNVNTVLGLAYPEIYSSFVQSQLQMYDDGELLPRAPVTGNYSMVMTGSPITSFITGAWNKGIRDFNINRAYDAMLDAQSLGGLYDKASSDYLNWGTGGNRSYLDLGYVSTEETGESAGQTLEYAHQDWALAQLASSLNKRGINTAQYATASASSQLDDAHSAERAVDGRPSRAPTDVEWRSAGEQDPWIELTWDEPRELRQIAISDRADADSNVKAGLLEFSDGSQRVVRNIPTDGTGKVVRFRPREVDSVRFTVTDGEGENVGLNEIEAWDQTDVGDYLMQRSRNWRNVYDEEAGFSRPRNADGSWLEDFDPLSSRGFVQANSWQTTWFTSHDVMGLANLMGGEAAYADKLNYAFRRAEPARFFGSHGQGHVSYGNQPGLQVAHLFNYVGYPWLSQYWVRQVKEETYGSIATDDGYGHHDEDQGQMGAVSALMAIGLFEVTGGGQPRPVYDITSPVFDEITIELNQEYYDGDEFRIVTHDNSADNMYIQQAELNDDRLGNSWFHHDQLA